jgi:hypothetical protein
MPLQYADDTILFSSAEFPHLVNLKHVIMWFEQISGMRVNFRKSELLTLNLDEVEIKRAASIISCPIGAFTIKYLGVPQHYDNLTREDLQPLVDKLLSRIAGWRGKLLSLAARTLLIKTCLASILIYLLSFIKFPKWAIQILNSHMGNCLWNDLNDAHKYHLANWEFVAMSKDFGGLGVPNLRDSNICLLASWLRRYEKDKNKLWTEILDFKYNTKDPNILQTRGASPFFKGFMWAVQAAKMGYRWVIGNGEKVRFWEDNWLGTSSLAIQYWKLYRWVNEKNKSVASLWDGTDLKCSFSRMGDENMLELWEEVCQIASTINYSDEEDSMVWQFSSNGRFNVQSFYKVVNFRGIQPVFISSLWDIKIPPRVQYFLWLLSKNKLLTRDNLSKRRKVEDPTCSFCNEESIQHLFFTCVVAKQLWHVFSKTFDIHQLIVSFEDIGKFWLSNKCNGILNMFTLAAVWCLWKLRNDLCFQRSTWKSMAILLFQVAVMVEKWKILYPEEEVISQKVKLFKKEAAQVLWLQWR